MNSISWSATFGVVPGYGHDNDLGEQPEEIVIAEKIKAFTELWQEAMLEERSSSYFVVSAVVTAGRVIYPLDHGCPPGGELVIIASGSSNPVFDGGKLREFKFAVTNIVDRVREKLHQTTVRLEFTPIEIHYLRSPSDEPD